MTALLLLLLACKTESEEDVHEHPTIEILSPADGATVTAGDVAVSVVVEHFALGAHTAKNDPLWWSPIASAEAHEDEETPEGHVVFTVDGVEAGTSVETQSTLTIAAGAHTLVATLVADHGELEETVSDEVSFTAQ